MLLDVLSAPAGPISSLNTFMDERATGCRSWPRRSANVTAHEIGHTVGNYHTDNADDVHNVMDSGGANFARTSTGSAPTASVGPRTTRTSGS